MLRRYFPDRSKFTSLAMAVGRVVRKEVNQRAEVSVTRHRMNEHFLIFFPEKSTVQAYDPENKSNVGDIVLLKKLSDLRKHVETHRVEEIVHKTGEVVDPITGLRVEGDKYLPDHESSVVDEGMRKEVSEREKYYTYSHELGKEVYNWESRNLPKDKS